MSPKAVFPGAHWMESDNDSFGAIGKETTITFSWYPVAPRGQVNHGTIADFSNNFRIYGYSVSDADVMFYNE